MTSILGTEFPSMGLYKLQIYMPTLIRESLLSVIYTSSTTKSFFTDKFTDQFHTV